MKWKKAIISILLGCLAIILEIAVVAGFGFIMQACADKREEQIEKEEKIAMEIVQKKGEELNEKLIYYGIIEENAIEKSGVLDWIYLDDRGYVLHEYKYYYYYCIITFGNYTIETYVYYWPNRPAESVSFVMSIGKEINCNENGPLGFDISFSELESLLSFISDLYGINVSPEIIELYCNKEYLVDNFSDTSYNPSREEKQSMYECKVDPLCSIVYSTCVFYEPTDDEESTLFKDTSGYLWISIKFYNV